jgi:hypothetical protein
MTKPSTLRAIALQGWPPKRIVVPERWLETLAAAASLSSTSRGQPENGAARAMASARASASLSRVFSCAGVLPS